MNGKIILIEGFEATGKTTLAHDLVEHYDGIYFHCPSGKSELTNGIYDLFKANDMEEDTKLMMIMATHIENIKMMNTLKEMGETVICDRSLLSTYAYQHISYENFTTLLSVLDIQTLNYDHAFFLYADVDTVIKRLTERSEENDVLDDYFKIHMNRIISNYNTHAHVLYPDIHKISTVTKTQPEVLRKTLNIIKNQVTR